MEIKLRSGSTPPCVIGPLSIMTTTEDRACLGVARGWAEELLQKELVELREGLLELRFG
jgi:hypothetical protein